MGTTDSILQQQQRARRRPFTHTPAPGLRPPHALPPRRRKPHIAIPDVHANKLRRLSSATNSRSHILAPRAASLRFPRSTTRRREPRVSHRIPHRRLEVERSKRRRWPCGGAGERVSGKGGCEAPVTRAGCVAEEPLRKTGGLGLTCAVRHFPWASHWRQQAWMMINQIRCCKACWIQTTEHGAFQVLDHNHQPSLSCTSTVDRSRLVAGCVAP